MTPKDNYTIFVITNNQRNYMTNKKLNVQSLIKTFAKDNRLDLESGGGFFSAKVWEKKGNEYGGDSLGVICHDGGDMAPYINLDYECYALEEKFNKYLAKFGLYHEPCTCWYTAIYKI